MLRILTQAMLAALRPRLKHRRPCVHRLQYKFIVDCEWKYAPDQTAMYDEQGNVNNVLEVQEYVPENLESLSSFDPPPSPVSRRVGCPWRYACCDKPPL